VNQTKSYYHSIDLLRGLTALFVCIYHFINHQDANGYLFTEESTIRKISTVLPGSVYIFFLLSGYVIALSMDRQNFHIKRIGHFLLKRWVRIEIPYISSIVVYILIAYLWTLKANGQFDIDFERLLHHLTYTAGFFNHEWYNDVYWTLAIEFQFYILIALLFPLIMSKKPLIRYSVLIAFSLSAFVFPDNRLVFNYAPTFVLGIVLYLYFTTEKYKNINLMILLLCLIQIGFTFGITTSIFLLITLLLIKVSIPEKNIFCRFGKMGYSFYLMHGAIGGSLIYLLSKGIENDLMKYLIIVTAIIAATIGSAIFYRLIEFPSQKLSRKIKISDKKPAETGTTFSED
jgi:peptidoglycan/LPS O-acetylase OafA/YrhL